MLILVVGMSTTELGFFCDDLGVTYRGIFVRVAAPGAKFLLKSYRCVCVETPHELFRRVGDPPLQLAPADSSRVYLAGHSRNRDYMLWTKKAKPSSGWQGEATTFVLATAVGDGVGSGRSDAKQQDDDQPSGRALLAEARKICADAGGEHLKRFQRAQRGFKRERDAAQAVLKQNRREARAAGSGDSWDDVIHCDVPGCGVEISSWQYASRSEGGPTPVFFQCAHQSCANVDICADCFCSGAEFEAEGVRHRNDHPYKVGVVGKHLPSSVDPSWTLLQELEFTQFVSHDSAPLTKGGDDDDGSLDWNEVSRMMGGEGVAGQGGKTADQCRAFFRTMLTSHRL